MLNVLFWNLNKKSIGDYIAACIDDKNIDIACFAEYKEINFNSLQTSLGDLYNQVQGYNDNCKVTLFVKNNINVIVLQQQNRYSIYKIETVYDNYIFVVIHLPDRINYEYCDRNSEIRTIQNDIRLFEKEHNILKTVVIGDFNAGPYDQELLGVYDFNSVLFKSIIENDEYREYSYKKYKRFYNPILNYISEENEMFGSFYYTNKPFTSYWHCLDQCIVSKNLMNNIIMMEYLKKIKENTLLTDYGIPNKNISDHLPLFVKIKEDEEDD